jgi:hypothetical protein
MCANTTFLPTVGSQCPYCGATALYGTVHPYTPCPLLLAEHKRRVALLDAQIDAMKGAP